MEAIAKAAGVGVGTLYRHFPKRIDVVEAVYRDDVDGLVADGERASPTSSSPWAAVVEFLHAFVRYALGKRTFLNELHEAFEKDPSLKLRSRERIVAAMEPVLSRRTARRRRPHRRSGEDVMQLVGPMCTGGAAGRAAERAPRRLDPRRAARARLTARRPSIPAPTLAPPAGRPARHRRAREASPRADGGTSWPLPGTWRRCDEPPCAASSQTGRRGHDVRHTSSTSS